LASATESRPGRVGPNSPPSVIHRERDSLYSGLAALLDQFQLLHRPAGGPLGVACRNRLDPRGLGDLDMDSPAKTSGASCADSSVRVEQLSRVVCVCGGSLKTVGRSLAVGKLCPNLGGARGRTAPRLPRARLAPKYSAYFDYAKRSGTRRHALWEKNFPEAASAGGGDFSSSKSFRGPRNPVRRDTRWRKPDCIDMTLATPGA